MVSKAFGTFWRFLPFRQFLVFSAVFLLLLVLFVKIMAIFTILWSIFFNQWWGVLYIIIEFFMFFKPKRRIYPHFFDFFPPFVWPFPVSDHFYCCIHSRENEDEIQTMETSKPFVGVCGPKCRFFPFLGWGDMAVKGETAARRTSA